jgi:hypothetical protein
MAPHMLGVHLDNLLFLLLLAVAGLFQLLAKTLTKTKDDQTKPTSSSERTRPKPIPRGTAESDAERVRKFLEALGQPPSSQPPQPVPPRPTYRRPVVLRRIPPIASPLPPLVTRPPELPAEIEIRPETTAPRTQQPSPPRTFVEPAIQVSEAEAPPALTPIGATGASEPGAQQQILAASRSIDVTALLSSPTGLREAMIVLEVLGPPRGLRALEVIGS